MSYIPFSLSIIYFCVSLISYLTFYIKWFKKKLKFQTVLSKVGSIWFIVPFSSFERIWQQGEGSAIWFIVLRFLALSEFDNRRKLWFGLLLPHWALGGLDNKEEASIWSTIACSGFRQVWEQGGSHSFGNRFKEWQHNTIGEWIIGAKGQMKG
jgi:hypothetical protein